MADQSGSKGRWPLVFLAAILAAALADVRKGDSASTMEKEYYSAYRDALRSMRADIFGRG